MAVVPATVSLNSKSLFKNCKLGLLSLFHYQKLSSISGLHFLNLLRNCVGVGITKSLFKTQKSKVSGGRRPRKKTPFQFGHCPIIPPSSLVLHAIWGKFHFCFPPIYPSQRQNLLPTLEILIKIFQNFGKKFQNFEFFLKISKTTEGPPLRSKGPPPPY